MLIRSLSKYINTFAKMFQLKKSTMKNTEPRKNNKIKTPRKQKTVPDILVGEREKSVKGNKEQFRRWLFIDKLLSGNNKGYQVKDITKKVNEFLASEGISKRNGKAKTVSERTIYDDLKSIESIFSPKIQFERIKDEFDNIGFIRYAETGMSIFNVNISEEEYTRLKFILQQSRAFILPEIFEETEGLIDRLYNPSPLSISKQRFIPRNIIQTQRNESDGVWLNELIQHITNKHCISIEYNKSGLSNIRYKLAPLGLKEYRGKWYLIGHDLENFAKDQKIFRLSRIQNMYRIKDAFPSITAYFDLQDYFKYSIGIHHELSGKTIHVSVLLKNEFWIEELSLFKINETQSITLLGKEALLEFETYDSYELIEFIISLGATAEVKSPKKLRDDLALHLEGIRKNYI